MSRCVKFFAVIAVCGLLASFGCKKVTPTTAPEATGNQPTVEQKAKPAPAPTQAPTPAPAEEEPTPDTGGEDTGGEE